MWQYYTVLYQRGPLNTNNNQIITPITKSQTSVHYKFQINDIDSGDKQNTQTRPILETFIS